MKFDLLLRGGEVYLDGELKTADVGIIDGKIAAIEDLGSSSAQQELDAASLWILPGFIDTQVHFREPGLTHKEDLASGSTAAVVGGVTTVFEMPNTSPATISEEALAKKVDAARDRMRTNFAFFVGASKSNIHDLGELERLPGSAGIKIFMGSSTGDLLVDDDDSILQVLQSGVRRCSVHSEDEHRLRDRALKFSFWPDSSFHPFWRDAEAAVISTQRLISLAVESRRPVHILHISTADEIPIITAAKAANWDVTAEITPQHLLLSAPTCYQRLGSLAQMNPPIREEYHRRSLEKGLTEGVFDVFGSDHAPHLLEEKALPYLPGHGGSPSGLPGVQTLPLAVMKMVYEGKLPLSQAIEMTSLRPTELFGIKGKGQIKVGFDADFVAFEPNRSEVFRREMVLSRCGWSPFEGIELSRHPKWVIVNGALAAESGRVVGDPRGSLVQFVL